MYTSINMLPYTKWLSLPLGTRQKIAAEFNIPKLRSTHVANDQILDDGYNVADIEKYTSVESLQQYLGVKETDIFVLFQMLVDKVEGKLPPVPATPKEELIVSTTEATPIPIETITSTDTEPVEEVIPVHEEVVKVSLPTKKKKHGKKSKTNPQN